MLLKKIVRFLPLLLVITGAVVIIAVEYSMLGAGLALAGTAFSWAVIVENRITSEDIIDVLTEMK